MDGWEFPILAKYRLPLPFVKPFLAGGPSFRTSSSAIEHYLSKVGVTTGVGVEAAAWKVRLSPEVRFVHWGPMPPMQRYPMPLEGTRHSFC